MTITSPVRSILSLARSGATQRAWDSFQAAGLDRRAEDFDALTLKGRLLKDRARQSNGAERRALFELAGASYERAAALRPDTYPLINAAAMALFAGDIIHADLLASKVLHLIESGEDPGETPYWREATRAEALLLLGRTSDAQASLAKAMSLAPQAWEDHAATLGQFATILAERAVDFSWLDQLRPPPSLQFSGILGIDTDDMVAQAAIGDAIAQIAPGFGYGAIAAGADIIAAEALVAAGAELHIVLPSEPAEFRKASVDPFGDAWSQRFDKLLDQAHIVIVCGQGEPTSAAGVMLAEYHAMGLAIEKSAQLQTRAVALRIEPADRRVLDDPWTGTARPLQRVAVEISSNAMASPLPPGSLRFDVVVNAGMPQSFEFIDNAVAALREAGEGHAVIDCRIGDRMRVASLTSRGEAGLIIASRDAALALLASGYVERIEALGEMATLDGPIDICMVALRPKDN